MLQLAVAVSICNLISKPGQRYEYVFYLLIEMCVVYGIPGIPGIPDLAPKGISGIHGSRYTHIRLSLTGCRYSEDALPPPITWSADTE